MHQAQVVLERLEGKRPWLLKDPRLSWVAPLYMERLEEPLCIIMFRHPLVRVYG